MRTSFAFCATFLALSAPLAFAAELHPGDSIDGSVHAGATESYSLNLHAADVVSLTFSDSGQDVLLTVQTPKGEIARRFSSKNQNGQPASFYATESGVWQLAV